MLEISAVSKIEQTGRPLIWITPHFSLVQVHGELWSTHTVHFNPELCTEITQDSRQKSDVETKMGRSACQNSTWSTHALLERKKTTKKTRLHVHLCVCVSKRTKENLQLRCLHSIEPVSNEGGVFFLFPQQNTKM